MSLCEDKVKVRLHEEESFCLRNLSVLLWAQSRDPRHLKFSLLLFTNIWTRRYPEVVLLREKKKACIGIICLNAQDLNRALALKVFCYKNVFLLLFQEEKDFIALLNSSISVLYCNSSVLAFII